MIYAYFSSDYHKAVMGSKVLVIEDSPSFSAILKLLLEESGQFQVDVAISLAQARDYLSQSANEYFVATVDYTLPDAPDGEAIDLTLEFDIPSIVFTSSTDVTVKNDLWNKGISDYAIKTGVYNLDYVQWMVTRIFSNQHIEVLVVDDTRLEREHSKALLQTQGFIVHTVQSGEEALEHLESDKNVRVAIIDYNLGNINGLELTRKIRENYTREELEVIGISAISDRYLSAQFIKAGANDFVKKPFLPEELLCRTNHAVSRLEHYEKLEELNHIKNQFIGTAAHDIRGPLGAIKTASDLLISNESVTDRNLKLAGLINKSSIELLSLLEDLLDVSVIESGEVNLSTRKTDYSAMVLSRIDLYEGSAAEKELTIIRDIDDSIFITADEVKIKQVVDNLLTNAIKYSSKVGKIFISLVEIDGKARLSISDAGPGIPEKEQENLFKAFSAVSTLPTGGEKKTGLGLAISKSIVDAHGGNLTYSTEEQGPTFTVLLPTS